MSFAASLALTGALYPVTLGLLLALDRLAGWPLARALGFGQEQEN